MNDGPCGHKYFRRGRGRAVDGADGARYTDPQVIMGRPNAVEWYREVRRRSHVHRAPLIVAVIAGAVGNAIECALEGGRVRRVFAEGEP